MSYEMNISNKCAIKDTNIGVSRHRGLLLLLALGEAQVLHYDRDFQNKMPEELKEGV